MEKLIESKMENKSKSSDKWSIASLVFVGCMFTGIGLGMLFDARGTGMYVGMGAGFLAMGAVLYYFNRKSN